MEAGLKVKFFFMGIFYTVVLLSIHADYLGKEEYVKWVIESWMNTTVVQWIAIAIIGTVIFATTTLTIGK
jgi:hypothetical protein